MALRYLRVVVGLLLGTSGALMFAASWQRWTSVECVNVPAGRWCAGLEDHLYDFLPPRPRWEPVGDAAELAGCSMLILAVVFVLLPWALTGRRPGPLTAVVLLVAVLAQAAVGVATLLSGLTGTVVLKGTVVEPILISVTLKAWVFVTFGVLFWFAIKARGWTLAATLGLVLATPFASFITTYKFGSYDSRPWYEAISGSFTMVAGVCVLAAAVFGSRDQAPQSDNNQDSSTGDRGTGDGSSGASPGPAATARGRG